MRSLASDSKARQRFFLALLAAAALVVLACRNTAPDYPIVPTDDLVARGKPIYQEKCATCHGDATTPPPLAAAPPHTQQGHTWHHPDRLLVEWILDGVPLAEIMPKWRGKLTEEEVRAVVAYIKTFWPEETIKQQTGGSAEYEAQLLEP